MGNAKSSISVKPRRASKTLRFNDALSVLVVIAGAVLLYVPDLGLDKSLQSYILLSATLVATLGNRYLRIHHTSTRLE